MKRREILIASAGMIGAAMPGLLRSQPCTPSSLTLQGGQTVDSPCGMGAEADWMLRSTGPGVVWTHDFRNDAEVNNFRWDGGIGDDPNGVQTSNIFRQTGDGIAGTQGACIQITTAPGTQGPGIWWRPLSPLTGSGNGRGFDDPGANGSIAPESFAPNANYGGSTTNAWGSRGLYGPGPGSGFDGTECYLQMRTKISSSRYDPSNTGNYGRGKLVYFSHAYRTLTSQEIVTENRIDKTWKAYRSGSPEIEPSLQYGSDSGTLFKWKPDEWLTVLYYWKGFVTPSTNNIFRVWVARPGQTAYTKIWDTSQMHLETFDYDNGWNAICLCNYMNGDVWPAGGYVRHAQIIFSKSTIPCPQV